MKTNFSRPDKMSNAETVLYELNMFRFAAGRLSRGRWESENDKWALLECFLVHYRNLIEFLGKEKHLLRDDDVHVLNVWGVCGLSEPTQLAAFRAKGEVLWNKYERVPDSISRYLQHCTMQRTEGKTWEVGTMNAELESVVVDVEKALRDPHAAESPQRPVAFLNYASFSTTSPSMTELATDASPFTVGDVEREK